MNPQSFSNRQPRLRLLFGASGNLGSAISRSLGAEVETASWTWLAGLTAAEFGDFLGRRPPTDFIFANGLTNPRLPAREIEASNLEFPKRVAELSRGLDPDSPHRYLTFGSIQENFPQVCQANPYLGSKLRLSEWMGKACVRRGCSGRFLHLRIHTLYGDQPKEHMFLGQIATAIRESKSFRMSSGDQLREYHHREDIAAAIAGLLDRQWDFGPLLELNSGEPVRLADLARAIFQAFGREDLLEIGAIPRHSAENTDRRFERSPAWVLPRTREPIQGVIESLRRNFQ